MIRGAHIFVLVFEDLKNTTCKEISDLEFDCMKILDYISFILATPAVCNDLQDHIDHYNCLYIEIVCMLYC